MDTLHPKTLMQDAIYNKSNYKNLGYFISSQFPTTHWLCCGGTIIQLSQFEMQQYICKWTPNFNARH